MAGAITRAAVVGSGSIGRRHLAVLRSLLPHAALAMAPSRPASPAPPVVAEAGAAWLPSLDEVVAWEPRVAVVAVPAPWHLDVAAPLAAAGAALLVEKPLATDVEQVDAFAARAARDGWVVLVGHCLRHCPSVQAFRHAVRTGAVGRPLAVRADVGQDLPTWRPGLDPRRSVTGRADLGGGSLLELSHEIDLLAWTFGAPEVAGAVLRNLGVHGIDVEEWAELLLRWPTHDGTVAMDLVRRPSVRATTAWATEGTVRWDGLARRVDVTRPDGSTIAVHPPEPDPSAMYGAQMRHLLDCALGRAAPEVTLADGREVLRVCGDARARAASA